MLLLQVLNLTYQNYLNSEAESTLAQAEECLAEAAQKESGEEPVSVDGSSQETGPPGEKETPEDVHTEKEEHEEKAGKMVRPDKRKKKEKKKSAGKH